MQLIAVEYPERRLEFFEEQLAAANRRLDWSMKHNPDCYDHAEKGEVVSFYEWAVQMAEGNCEDVVRCKDCKHYNTVDWDGNVLCGCNLKSGMVDITPDGFCFYGERKDGDGND